jgi:hypothetical protein
MLAPARARKPRSTRFLLKNASAAALTNSTSKEAVNRARTSTTGCKPKRRFFGPKATPVSTNRLKSLFRLATLPLTNL